jgi:hypothetical protein
MEYPAGLGWEGHLYLHNMSRGGEAAPPVQLEPSFKHLPSHAAVRAETIHTWDPELSAKPLSTLLLWGETASCRQRC